MCFFMFVLFCTFKLKRLLVIKFMLQTPALFVLSFRSGQMQAVKASKYASIMQCTLNNTHINNITVFSQLLHVQKYPNCAKNSVERT